MLDPATAFPLHLTQGMPITPGEVCPCCRPLLFHHEYMTAYLERQYHCHIHLQKIAQWHDQHYLIRQVLLNDEAHRTYIISQIKIYLTQFSLAIQEQLVHSDLPFGRILSELDIQPVFAKRQFLKRMNPVSLELDTIPARLCQDLRKIVLARRADADSTQIVRQEGLSRGFEQHAASLRNGLRVQAQMRPARATQPGRFCVSPICDNHFGRFHQILNHRQQILADVHEWVA